MTEEQIVPDFEVRLPSDTEPPMGDPGKSLVAEVTALRTNVQQLCTAVRGLVTLLSVLDKKVDTALKGGVGADFGVLG
jgi:hypothetical protein